MVMEYRENDPWILAMIAKGHVPKREADGSVDIFVQDSDIHNGPGCSVCGESWCWHCTDAEDIKPCIGEDAAKKRDAEATLRHEEYILRKAEEITARRAKNEA